MVNLPIEKQPLPVEKQDMPILAHRAARLMLTNGKPEFQSLTTGDTLGLDSDFRCRCLSLVSHGFRTPRHAQVTPFGSCGFYAIPPDLPSEYCDPRFVNLLVGLSGRVILCERGYRAEHQRILECQIPKCICGDKAECLIFDREDECLKISLCHGCSLGWSKIYGRTRDEFHLPLSAFDPGVPLVEATWDINWLGKPLKP